MLFLLVTNDADLGSFGRTKQAFQQLNLGSTITHQGLHLNNEIAPNKGVYWVRPPTF